MRLGTVQELSQEALLAALRGVGRRHMIIIQGQGNPLADYSERPGLGKVRYRAPVAEPQ